jgi:hypothetical protein
LKKVNRNDNDDANTYTWEFKEPNSPYSIGNFDDLDNGEYVYRYFQNNNFTVVDSGSITIEGNDNGGGGNNYSLEMEAEDANINGLDIGNDNSASGSQYLKGANHSGNAVFTFNVTESGTYKVKGRYIAPNGSSDSFFVKMDNGTEYIWDLTNTDNWRETFVSARGENGYMHYQLGAGEHTFTIKGRESGAKLDWLELVKVDDNGGGGGGDHPYSNINIDEKYITYLNEIFGENNYAQLNAIDDGIHLFESQGDMGRYAYSAFLLTWYNEDETIKKFEHRGATVGRIFITSNTLNSFEESDAYSVINEFGLNKDTALTNLVNNLHNYENNYMPSRNNFSNFGYEIDGASEDYHIDKEPENEDNAPFLIKFAYEWYKLANEDSENGRDFKKAQDTVYFTDTHKLVLDTIKS